MNTNPVKKSILLALAIPFTWMLDAQIKVLDPVFNPGHFKIHQIGPEEGMSAPFLCSAHQDRFGHIWLGTQYGVDVYDGYQFRNIRIKDKDTAYSQLDFVFHFADDEDGGLWLCSINGLYYYDRSREELVEHLPLPETTDSPENYIHGIYLDSKGLKWLFTEAGLLIYDRIGDTILYTGIPMSPMWEYSNIKNLDLLELDDGSIWIPASPNGLYKYERGTGTFTNYRHDPEDANSLSSDNVTDIIQDNQGNLLITTLGGGLNIMSDREQDKFEHVRYEPGDANTLFSDSLTRFEMGHSGEIWIIGNKGFSRYIPDRNKLKSYRIRDRYFDYESGFDIRLLRILIDRDGDLWLKPLDAKGLFHFNTETESLYQFIDVQEEDVGFKGDSRIYDMFIDRDGLIWAMTEGALNIIEKDPLKPFHLIRSEKNDPTTLSNSMIWSFFLDSDNTLWMGAGGPVLNKCTGIDNNLPVRFHHYPVFDWLYHPTAVTSISEDNRGELWIGTYWGIYTFNRAREKYTPFNTKPALDTVFDEIVIDNIYKDPQGCLWMGSRGWGLYIYDPASDELVHLYHDPDNPEGLPSDQVFAFCLDRSGNMWLGHFGGGLTLLAKDEIPKIFGSGDPRFKNYSNLYESSAGLSSDQVVQVYQDSHDRIWVGTTAGLNLFDPGPERFHSFSMADGLPSDCICGMLEDDHGNLWISTLKGICKIELKEGYGPGILKSIRSYGSYEGIKQPVFHEKAYLRSPDGWMYFGGFYGVTVFHPDSIKESSLIPPVHITNILINEKAITEQAPNLVDHSVMETGSIRLPYRQNFISFEYIALNYLNAEMNQYKYMMEGLDEDWVDAETRRFAEYRDLKPGEYTFRVIACNEDGLWNEEGASIMISIDPPWYRSMLAYFVYAILLLAAVYGYIRWRTWRIRMERDELDALVKERTKVIEDQNKNITEANTQLEEQKEELEQQTEELTQQKEELQITLDRLKETQEQLIQSEKLAALGGLVAGVAHEINTPVGISVTAASNLAEETKAMAAKFKANKISRAEFKEYLSTANQSAKLILANMERTAEMVQSFKQISADQSTGEKRRVVLRTYLEDIIRSLYPKLKGRRIGINLDIDPNLEVESYPGAVSQIFTNLILNSLVHGFTDKEKGEISIQSELKDGNLNINYSDSGKGIAEENMKKIFDPFFTTNKKAGTGLGLHIVYNLVTQKLNGTIDCDSKPGEGAEFRITVPLK